MTVELEGRLQELRELVTQDRRAVVEQRDHGDVAAGQAVLEADYLAGTAGIPQPLTDLPFAPAVIERALADAADARVTLPTRFFERLGIRTLDYRQASRLARRVAETPDSVLDSFGFPRRKIALIGGVTTDFVQPVLQASLVEHGIVADVRSGPFGQLEETVLEKESWLVDLEPDFVVVLDSALAHEETRAQWEELVERRAQLCNAIATRLSADAIVTTLETASGADWLEKYNEALATSLPENGFVFDLNTLASELGDRWSDRRYWELAKQSVALNAVPILADRLAAFIRALVDPPVRLVVTDLDDTLWGGEVAEIGSAALEIGGGYVELQDLLHQWAERGALLAAVSKNVDATARAPFSERPEMVLKLADFAAIEFSFAPKSLLVAQMAERLSLGLRNILFLDNDAHERAEMREHCAEVIVPEWPAGGIAAVPRLLERRGWTLRPRLTEADRNRLALYQDEAARSRGRTNFANVDEFLATLELTARVERIGAASLDRVTQLVSKTNQFNLTTRRRTRREIEAMIDMPNSYAHTVEIGDRYGPYGLTGVLVAVPKDDAALEIDLWLLSCRVMGKTIEYAMFEHLVGHARAHGFEKIVGIFRPTERNASVAGLFSDLGFTDLDSDGDEQRYEFRVADEPAHPNRHVTVIEGETEEVRS